VPLKRYPGLTFRNGRFQAESKLGGRWNAQGLMLKYSRGDEAQADAVGASEDG
jgi:hypothetical protein